MSLEIDESSSGTTSSSGSVSIQSLPSLSSYESANTYSALRKGDSNVTLDTVVTKDKIVTTTVAPVPEIQPIVSDCPPWLHDVGIGELPKVVVSSDSHRLEFVSAPCNSKVNYRSFNYIQKSRCAPSATIRLKNQSQFQKILYTNTSFATHYILIVRRFACCHECVRNYCPLLSCYHS